MFKMVVQIGSPVTLGEMDYSALDIVHTQCKVANVVGHLSGTVQYMHTESLHKVGYTAEINNKKSSLLFRI